MAGNNGRHLCEIIRQKLDALGYSLEKCSYRREVGRCGASKVLNIDAKPHRDWEKQDEGLKTAIEKKQRGEGSNRTLPSGPEVSRQGLEEAVLRRRDQHPQGP